MEDIKIPELPIKEIPKVAPVKEKHGVMSMIFVALLCFVFGSVSFGVLIFTGGTDAFMTDGQCDDMINNATNISFIYGANYGMEYAIVSITQEAVQCKEIPIEYSNYSYTLIAIECLEGVQNG